MDYNWRNTGTYYYQCTAHNDMYGTITVQANNTAGQSGDDVGIKCYIGDILVFDTTAGSSHPFYIKTIQGTGTGNQVTTGKIGGDGFAHNSAQSLDIGVDEFKSYANELFNAGETYTLSGDSISNTGLTFNTTTGVYLVQLPHHTKIHSSTSQSQRTVLENQETIISIHWVLVLLLLSEINHLM